MAGGNAEKGARYIAALDQARAQDKWDEVPELIRKVTKHVPQRTCVIQTATAESRVVAYLQQKTTTESPSTPNLPELIPALLTTIENADGTPQEIVQAQVCLGWIHWTLNEPSLAVGRLPKNLTVTMESLVNEGSSLTTWTEVCLVKGCYIKGLAQLTTAGIDDTLETFASLVPWLSGGMLANTTNAQFLSWAETMLRKGATAASEEASRSLPSSNPRHVEIALQLFRLWSAHPAVKQGLASPNASFADSSDQPSHTSIWQSYYRFLTTVLQNGLEYTAPNDGPERPQLASELRRIESICEGHLLREVKFPTASSNNSQMEEWVELVISNWEVLCGPRWQDSDLGEGGQNAVGRNVLDILYRAATKTYHSHLILRRLFHVHSALADFDLAVQALDSYIEIVTAAKERARKSAEYGELEKDSILLQTLSEGVTLLSCLGSYEEAEKAKDLTELIREYIPKQVSNNANGKPNGQLVLSRSPNSPNSPEVPPPVLATAYRAVGVGLANWASYTPLNESRDEIRGEAIEYLEKSVDPELSSETSYASLYTLSIALAENRDLDTAISYVKSALTSHDSSIASDNLTEERDLVPLWHLLALLLSAKHEFEIAERSCEAAFEPFPAEIFAKNNRERRSSRHSQQNPTMSKRTLVGHLQGREKERIIQTRITQLAFVEILEGPEAAVNQTEQLLSLFGTLFQELNLEDGSNKASKPEHLVPPKSSAGTTKSFRSSIFSRHRSSQPPDRRTVSSTSSNVPAVPPIPNGHSIGTDAPAIQITDEDHAHSPSLGRSDSKRLKKRSSSFHRNEKPRIQEPPLPHESESPEMVGIAVSGNSSPVPSAQTSSRRQPLQPVAHNIHHRQQPPPAGHEKQPPEQDVRLPVAPENIRLSVSHRFDSPTNATTKFSIIQSRKHALALLIRIWLIIAGLYRRASLFDDAREACEEAWKQAAQMEALASSEESSARSFSRRGWTAAKSPEELWADVFAEQGLLAQAQSNPHQAIKLFEDALLRHSEHPTATIGLANLLLDIWDQNLPAEPSAADVNLNASRISLLSETTKPKSGKAISADELKVFDATETQQPVEASSAHDVDPKKLHRLAARDRAYGLLSALTKQGSSWDNSEAWYALARAYEAGEQVEKLKEVLWWCIELEDRRPIRHWSNIGSGLYVL
ncbi:Tetratricopeptide-like helical [Penicillium hispanicum]|uniref:Tetratricopeptide-like helical n=1 Tax=Penicillium hispanicum TaxID=1080232 RepID=UPI0025403305|nr:Tetratricopeptide-like helical [Penicillium hispanicum]KAJ5573645.1 Tetratricopeptide-like helical [Penicillium hispanicum]